MKDKYLAAIAFKGTFAAMSREGKVINDDYNVNRAVVGVCRGERMEFGWISVFGATIVILMLIPNIVYAIKNKSEKNLCTNRFMNVVEQIGRYSCIVLMWLPLIVWQFGFASVFEMVFYMVCNGTLLAAYWISFAIYMKRKTVRLALVLAILPACMFLLSGILLRHWLLVCFAVLFAVGHIYVTYKNIETDRSEFTEDC